MPEGSRSELEFVKPQFDDFGRQLSPGGYFDPVTGEFVPDSSLGVPSGVRQPGGVNFSSPEVKSYLGDLFGVGTEGGWCGVYASSISTAAPVGDYWSEKISAVDKKDNPTAGDKMVIPVGVTDANKSYGHVVTVIDYNEATGDIYVVESNADGRQNRGEGNGVISLGTYNINELRTQYGENFGFVSGELKEPYKSGVEGISMTYGSTYSQPAGNTDQFIAEAAMLGLTGDALQAYVASRQAGYSMEDLTSKTLSDEEFDKVTELQTKYKPLVDEVRTLEQGFAVTEGFDVNHENPYTDQALIFSFMKVLDPGSVVREGEFNVAMKNASILDQFSAAWRKAIDGTGMIKPEQRQKIIDEMNRLYDSKRSSYDDELNNAQLVGERY